MRAAYARIFTRMALDFRIVHADTGAIGGSKSEEFQVLAASGEDAIAVSDGDDFAANVELATALPPATPRPAPAAAMVRVPTPGAKTIAELSAQLNVAPAQCLKTLLVAGNEGAPVALILRGDHELNAVKAQRIAGVATPLRLASAAEVSAACGCEPGYIGPVGLTPRWPWRISSAAPTKKICTTPA
jgi:prolyl-tRNA synthetase